ncbi:chorismate mutase I / prephenate dehydratase, ACT domain [Yersinia pestis Pestoides A]|nr:chorismate mutase I / prephenate dehydratase, ACT domain [Yersinia pestis Pestoides A]
MVSALLLLSALLVSATALAVLVLLATAADHEDADKDPNATPIMTHKRRGAVTNGAIVIHTQRLKSDPGGNLLS